MVAHGERSEPWFFQGGAECPRLAENAQRGYPRESPPVTKKL